MMSALWHGRFYCWKYPFTVVWNTLSKHYAQLAVSGRRQVSPHIFQHWASKQGRMLPMIHTFNVVSIYICWSKMCHSLPSFLLFSCPVVVISCPQQRQSLRSLMVNLFQSFSVLRCFSAHHCCIMLSFALSDLIFMPGHAPLTPLIAFTYSTAAYCFYTMQWQRTSYGQLFQSCCNHHVWHLWPYRGDQILSRLFWNVVEI